MTPRPVLLLLLVLAVYGLGHLYVSLQGRPAAAPAVAAPLPDPAGKRKPSPGAGHRRMGRGQVRFCIRGLCAGPERWATQSLRHARAAARLRRRLALVERRLEELRRLRVARTPQLHQPDTGWRARQIAAAETIGRESSGDPWPNCPDPYDGSGASWDQTVQCENGGSWLDSPGFYRCGLQFDPAWERRFGALCP